MALFSIELGTHHVIVVALFAESQISVVLGFSHHGWFDADRILPNNSREGPYEEEQVALV